MLPILYHIDRLDNLAKFKAFLKRKEELPELKRPLPDVVKDLFGRRVIPRLDVVMAEDDNNNYKYVTTMSSRHLIDQLSALECGVVDSHEYNIWYAEEILTAYYEGQNHSREHIHNFLQSKNISYTAEMSISELIRLVVEDAFSHGVDIRHFDLSCP